MSGVTERDRTTQATAGVFGPLWERYDDRLFEESVGLFARRFEANGFDLGWFEGKRALDAGCGGGRYTIAMARLGATAVGCDIAPRGLVDARRRASGDPRARFLAASVLELPYPDEAFDFVCCSGVLHHTPDPARGLAELVRVLRRGGRLFTLLYGTGGLRWPLIMRVRPFAQAMGVGVVDEAMRRAGLAPNKQRTFLDDLFVPLIRFYDWAEVSALCAASGLHQVQRWEQGRLDHEESVPLQRTEFEQLQAVFDTVCTEADPRFLAQRAPASAAAAAVREAIGTLDAAAVSLTPASLRDRVFGWGHHRVLAVKG